MRRVIAALLFASAAALTPATAQVDSLVLTRDSSTFYPGGNGIPLVMLEGRRLMYQNIDGFQPHNLWSVDRKADGSRLFMSPLMPQWNLGRGIEPVEVAGAEQLAPGSYEFYCDVHPLMRGTLTILS